MTDCRVTCPKCSKSFEPGSSRAEIERYIREKLDGMGYSDSSYEWMGDELYVNLDHGSSIVTRTIQRGSLPEGWDVGNIWVDSDETTISIVEVDADE